MAAPRTRMFARLYGNCDRTFRGAQLQSLDGPLPVRPDFAAPDPQQTFAKPGLRNLPGYPIRSADATILNETQYVMPMHSDP